MSLKIKNKSINTIAKHITNTSNFYLTDDEAEDVVYSTQECVRTIAAKYFWLPVFKLFLKARLIDKDLNINYFMMQQVFAQRINKGQPCETPDSFVEADLTGPGFQFLESLIEKLSDENLHLAPQGTYSFTKLSNDANGK